MSREVREASEGLTWSVETYGVWKRREWHRTSYTGCGTGRGNRTHQGHLVEVVMSPAILPRMSVEEVVVQPLKKVLRLNLRPGGHVNLLQYSPGLRQLPMHLLQYV